MCSAFAFRSRSASNASALITCGPTQPSTDLFERTLTILLEKISIPEELFKAELKLFHRDKLCGGNPCEVTIRELKCGNSPYVAKLVRAVEGSRRQQFSKVSP